MTKNKKAYEELIKTGVDAELSSVKEVITDEEVLEMGYSLPPEGILDKAKETYAAKKATENSKKHVNIRRIILLVAVLIIMSVAVAVSTTGYKKYQRNSKDEIEDNAIRFSSTSDNTYNHSPEEDTAYKNVEQALGVSLLKPSYLPSGFEFSKIKLYNDEETLICYKSSSNEIRMSQYLLTHSQSSEEILDAESQEVYTIDAHGTNIKVKEYTQETTGKTWLNAIWYGSELMYKVDSNCSREEFNKFIENLE